MVWNHKTYLGKNEQSARKESGFNETEEESSRHHSAKVVDYTGTRRDGSPEQHCGGNVPRWTADLVDDHVGRDLHENVSDVKAGISAGFETTVA